MEFHKAVALHTLSPPSSTDLK